MIVKYTGKSCVSLTSGKIYKVIRVEKGWYRLVDDTKEDYLFAPGEFEVVKSLGGNDESSRESSDVAMGDQTPPEGE